MIQAALEREVEEDLERQPYQRSTEKEEFRGYRKGHGRERSFTGGFGTIEVRVPLPSVC